MPDAHWGHITALRILNTITRWLFGRVLVKVVRVSDSKTIEWYWDDAERHPLVGREK